MILLFCGLSGAGKSTLAQRTRDLLTQHAVPVEIIDGDPYRAALFPDLGFSREDRSNNLRRLGFIADKFAAHGIVAIISAISPYDAVRQELVQRYRHVKVVHIDCPLGELRRRDTKGLYRRADLPDGHPDKLHCLTGVNDPFEAPAAPDLYLDTARHDVDSCAAQIVALVRAHRAG